MENNYIIINKTTLEKELNIIEKIEDGDFVRRVVWKTLIKIIEKSIPLIPEIEKAFDEGSVAHSNSQNSNHPLTFLEDKKIYIKQLKLDI